MAFLRRTLTRNGHEAHSRRVKSAIVPLALKGLEPEIRFNVLVSTLTNDNVSLEISAILLLPGPISE